jgi:GT2 family glycosyltransferase/glycosyltransferase involved in cell wall biosynthesis
MVSGGWRNLDWETERIAVLDHLPLLGAGAVWAHFDPVFYRAHYAASLPDPAASDAALAAFYHAEGAARGDSPNPYFAESWYVSAYRDVAAQIKAGLFVSGFAHYLATGFRDRSPHWLFSERFYLAGNPDLTRSRLDEAGFVNAYDHYITAGDREFRAGHLFFDPRMFAAAHPGVDFSQVGPFTQFLLADGAAGSTARLSWYFDPAWYLAAYPAVSESSCALGHYLCNDQPRQYDPSPFFSESFYTAMHVDVTPAIDKREFRNGYDHFIQFGVFECRKPHPDIDLAKYFRAVEVQADIQNGKCRDAFAHYVWKSSIGALAEPRIAISEPMSRELFGLRARHLRPLFARRKIDFSHAGSPAVSVILVMYNQIDLTLAALDSLRGNFSGAIELILADSGSTDESRHVERYVDGAKIIRFNHNVGFIEACNAALGHAAAPVTLYMNNDILLQRGAIEAALSRLVADPKTGAVGGKIIRTNGALQEAGCIVWRDGSTQGYLRDADPNIPEANFVRDVDFCSGVFLAVKTDLAKTLGGFDEDLKPAYFEETDFCLRLRQAGYKTIYDPAITIIHQEYSSGDASIATVMMAQNHPKFKAKHGEFLKTRFPRDVERVAEARSPRGDGRRILFIEDRIPLRHLGSGFTRSNDVIATMADLGHQVTVFPIYRPVENIIDLYGDFLDTVELVHDRELPDLAVFLEQRAGCFDIIWIARTHNAERLRETLQDAAPHIRGARIVLDTEAIAAVRDAARAALTSAETRPLAAAVKTELASADLAEILVAVNEPDAALIRAAGHSRIAILGHARRLAPTPRPFAARAGLLFVGAVHDADSPNLDGLNYFAEHILPLLDSALPADAPITIAGYINRRLDLSRLGQARRVILAGPQDDLTDLYDRHRVFFAPTRFAAGIPFKLHEAASYGLPIVATSILADQLGWRHDRELFTASPADPASFAAHLVQLYDDPELWRRLREAALDRLAAENSFEIYQAALTKILTPS